MAGIACKVARPNWPSFPVVLWIVLVPSWLGGVIALPVFAQSASRPNILWISVEDLSPRVGAYGDSLAQTPNLDRLASEGMRFTNAFTTAGVCSPSRASIFTGMFQTSIGAHHMRVTSDDEGLPGPYLATPPSYVKGFTEYLRAAGYYAANYGKTDYQVASQSNPREPITAWDESEGYRADATVLPVWRHRKTDQPFFVVLNSMRTHESRVWPDSTESRITDPEAVEVPTYYPDTPIVRADLARHYDNIARMDSWVGEVLASLEADGLADSTIVFFWSDHGDGLPRAKRWLYDSGLRVPLIIRWPGVLPAGSVDDELVSFVDLAPTVLSIADVEIPSHFQGRAFLGSHRAPAPQYVFAARDRIDGSYDRVRAVRDSRYKYIRNFFPEKPYILPVPYRDRMPTMQELLRLRSTGATGPVSLWLRDRRPPEELYDTADDPFETDNLADNPEFSEKLAAMRAALEGWQERTGDMGSISEAEMVETFWPEHSQPRTSAPKFYMDLGTETRAVQGVVSLSELDRSAIAILCETEGASIAFTTDPDEPRHWLLYTGPLRFDNPATLRARAIRYGYAESEEAKLEVGS